MFYIRLALTALRSLDSHFLRSLLATVGVLIGVSSVVACMSILEGASNDIVRRFKSLGSNVLYIMPEVARVEGRPVGIAQTLTLDDIGTLMQALPNEIERVAPEAAGSALIKRFQKSEEQQVIATTTAYFEINDYKTEHGRVLSKSESDDESATVACIGSKVADKFFGGADPVGQTIKVGGASFRIIGVLEKKGSLGFLPVDTCVFIPIKTGLKRVFNRKYLTRLTVAAKKTDKLDELQKKVTRELRTAHGVRPGQPDDFSIFNQEEALENIRGFMVVFRVVFYSIAGISLVVGGIGIMNIMLVSVTERTREIGVRIAVGARRIDVLLQFLFEAMVISLLGGAIGLLLGAMFADLMEKVLKQMNFKTEINTTVVEVALGTAVVVGALSGIYPAFKASRLDPVDALRYE